MSEKEMICPLMSNGKEVAKCVKNKCPMWIEVYTTELIRVNDCSIALIPQMVDGQLRV